MDEIVPESSPIGAEDSLRWSTNKTLFGRPRSPSLEGNTSPHHKPQSETPSFRITRTGKNKVDVPCSQVSDASTSKPKGASHPSNLLPNGGFKTLVSSPSVDVQEDEFTSATRCTSSPSATTSLPLPTSNIPHAFPLQNGVMEYPDSSIPTELTPKLARLQRETTTQPKQLSTPNNSQGLSNLPSCHDPGNENIGKESPRLRRAHIDDTPSAQILSGLVSQESQNSPLRQKISSRNKTTVEREDRAMVDGQRGLKTVNVRGNSLASQKGIGKGGGGVPDDQMVRRVEERLENVERKVAIAGGERVRKLAETEEAQNAEEARRVDISKKVENEAARNVKKDQEKKAKYTQIQKANNEKLRVKEQLGAREKKIEETKNNVGTEKKRAETERKKAGIAAEKLLKGGEELKKIGKELIAGEKAGEDEGKRQEKSTKQRENQAGAVPQKVKAKATAVGEDSIQKRGVAPPADEELPAVQVGRKRQLSEGPLALEKGKGKKQKTTKALEKETASAPRQITTPVAKLRRSVSFVDVNQPVLTAQSPGVSENSMAQKTPIPTAVPQPGFSPAEKPAAKKAKIGAETLRTRSQRKLSKDIVESSGSDSEVAQQISECIRTSSMHTGDFKRPVGPTKPNSELKRGTNKESNSGSKSESESESESEPESESDLDSESEPEQEETRNIEVKNAKPTETKKGPTPRIGGHVTRAVKSPVPYAVKETVAGRGMENSLHDSKNKEVGPSKLQKTPEGEAQLPASQ